VCVCVCVPQVVNIDWLYTLSVDALAELYE